MYKPNQDCIINATTGQHDLYGQPLPGVATRERCAIVKLNIKSERSALRTDQSPSHGASREFEDEAKILLGKTTVAQIDDLITVVGVTLRITSRMPRHNLQGALDHYEIQGTYWSA